MHLPPQLCVRQRDKHRFAGSCTCLCCAWCVVAQVLQVTGVVCLAGPEGTPYHGGCYMFDVFFPQDYPNVPPLMNMATNGEGRARFNPNLYADGKVSTVFLAYILAQICYCLQLELGHCQPAQNPSSCLL